MKGAGCETLLRALCIGCVTLAWPLSQAKAWPFNDEQPSAQNAVSREGLNRLRRDPDEFVFFGDMAYKFSELERLGFSGRKWPSGILPIAFASNVSQQNQERFFAACAAWSEVARVRCLRRTIEPDYIQVESGPGNWSQVGRRGGMQRLQLYNWSWKYIIAHEIAHALGAGHEQNRPERNQYVEIHWENIANPDDVGHNFKILAMSTYQQSYDFKSIMHYSPYAFSKNGMPTISPRPGYENKGSEMGNRKALSEGDGSNMRVHYGSPLAHGDTLASAADAPAFGAHRSAGLASLGPRAVWEDKRFENNIGKMGAQDKVFDSERVKPNTFLDTVGITEPDSNMAMCTGTLVGPKTVLTAKHCVCDGINGQVLIGEEELSAQRYPVAASFPARDQCSQPVTPDDLDIGLLVLSDPIAGVTPRKLAPSDLIDKAYSYRVIGFGYFDRPDGGLAAGEKRETVVPATSNDCRGRPGGWTVPDHEAYGCMKGVEIVAGSPGLGRDTCNGDSGGPLFVGPDFHGGLAVPDGDLQLAGVTSRAIRINTGDIPCGDGGIYVRITEEVKRWIDQHSPR